MSAPVSDRVGTFCWPELCSGDAAASKAFYGGVFGWEAHDKGMPEGAYTIFRSDGQDVGAMYEMNEERKRAGVRPHWNSYVAVADADETARKAAELGGKVLGGPFDGTDVDRMANLQDPEGVTFCIWQSMGPHDPVRLGDVNSLCWTELYTSDAEKAKAFYSSLFGWRAQPFEDGSHYTIFSLPDDERGVGGMMTMCSEMPGGPHWLPYFRVEDTDGTVERVGELGGIVANPPMDIPKVGRIAMFADPQGATFAVIQVAP